MKRFIAEFNTFIGSFPSPHILKHLMLHLRRLAPWVRVHTNIMTAKHLRTIFTIPANTAKALRLHKLDVSDVEEVLTAVQALGADVIKTPEELLITERLTQTRSSQVGPHPPSARTSAPLQKPVAARP